MWNVIKGKLIKGNQCKKRQKGINSPKNRLFFPCFKSIVKELCMLLVMYQKQVILDTLEQVLNSVPLSFEYRKWNKTQPTTDLINNLCNLQDRNLLIVMISYPSYSLSIYCNESNLPYLDLFHVCLLFHALISFEIFQNNSPY